MTLFALKYEDESVLYYNNETNQVLDENGNSIFERTDEKPVYKKVIPVSPENPVKKSTAPKKLKIQLGLKCNYSCAYCSQATQVGEAFNTNAVDAQEFMDRLDEWLTGDPESIELWGGEPFLYWKKIKLMLPLLKERFPKASLLIITNGSMFNQEIIDMIEEYDIAIGISHDAEGQPLRGPDPLQDPEKRKWIEHLIERRPGKVSVNAVMTAGNHDPNKIMDWFYREFGPDLQVSFEGVVNDYSEGDVGHVREFTQEEYSELSTNILKGLFDGRLGKTYYFGSRADTFMQSLFNERHSETIGQKCGMDRPDNVAVDLMGNLMTCQNTGAKGEHKIGNVYEGGGALDTSYHWSTRKECGNCPVLHLCKGSCMFLTGDNWSRSCNNEYYTALPIFYAVMSNLVGKRLMAIDGEIIRPDYQIPKSNKINLVNV